MHRFLKHSRDEGVSYVKDYLSLKKIVYALILLYICLLPLWPFVMTDSEYMVDLGEGNPSEKYALSGNLICQEIECSGNVDKLGLYFLKEEDAPKKEDIEVKIVSDSGLYECKIPIRDIVSGRYYDLNVYGKGICNTFTVEITHKGASGVYVLLSADEKSGLANAKVNGAEKKAPLLMRYNFTDLKENTIVSIVLYIVIALLIIVIVLVSESKKIQNWQFALFSALIIVLIICIRQPTASYLGEPRSEAAYDFWKKAEERGFFGSLFSLECDLYYLSFLQRIGAWIATKISPSAKYVFIVMQMIQTIFIAFECALVWSRKLIVDIDNGMRFVLAISLGTVFAPLYTYYYHFFGYWGIIFILLIAILDMDSLKKRWYVCIMCITSVVCLSKMAYVVLIPFAIIMSILYIPEMKEKKRYYVWLMNIFVSSLFQVVYSLKHTTALDMPKGALGTITVPPILKLINGLFYYVVQAINTFCFGTIHANAKLYNVVILIGLLSFGAVVIYFAICKKNIYMKIVLALGVMMFSVLGFLMITSGGGFNMVDCIDWNTNILLLHVHYFFIKYILIFAILLSVENIQIKKLKQIVICCVMCFSVLVSYPVNNPNDYTSTSKVRCYPTEWRRIYGVVNNESYYVPINTEWQFAGISLMKNSYGALFGYDEEGAWKVLGTGIPFDDKIKYNEAMIPELQTGNLLLISVRKANTYLNHPYVLRAYDTNGQLLIEKSQINSDDREWVDFVFDGGLMGVNRIEIIDEKTGKPGYVCGELNVGVSTL